EGFQRVAQMFGLETEAVHIPGARVPVQFAAGLEVIAHQLGQDAPGVQRRRFVRLPGECAMLHRPLISQAPRAMSGYKDGLRARSVLRATACGDGPVVRGFRVPVAGFRRVRLLSAVRVRYRRSAPARRTSSACEVLCGPFFGAPAGRCWQRCANIREAGEWKRVNRAPRPHRPGWPPAGLETPCGAEALRYEIAHVRGASALAPPLL